MTNTEGNTQMKHRVLAGRQVLGKLETMLVRHEEETGQGQNQGTSGGIILNKRTALRRNYEEFIPRRKPGWETQAKLKDQCQGREVQMLVSVKDRKCATALHHLKI